MRPILFLALAILVVPSLAAQPSNEKARELFNAGKYDEALKELQTAHQANPKLPPPRVTLAIYFFQAKQGPTARMQLELAAAEDPMHPEIYLLNGNFAINEGRNTDAILSCQAALTLATGPRWDPEQRKRFTREARLGLASGFETRRDWKAAQEQLAALLQDDAKSAVLRQRMATALFRLGQVDQAFTELQKAHQDDPAADLPELRMASLHASENQYPKAEEWIKKGIATHPTSPKPLWSYAAWLLEEGKLDQAQIQVDAAAKLAATARETSTLRGLLARYRKDFATAETQFESLYRDSPADTISAWNLALALAESGNKDKIRRAVELAEAEVRKNQRSSEGLAILGWCYAKAERLDEAERALDAAAKTGQLSRDAAYFLAKILADRQRYVQAHQLLKTVDLARGAFVYRAESQALRVEVEKKVPKDEKKEEKK